MRTAVHLISAPWAYPSIAPIQTGALAAWVAARFGDEVSVRTVPAFLDVLFQVAGADFIHFHRHWNERHRELLSMLAFRSVHPGETPLTVDVVEAACALINEDAEVRRQRRGFVHDFTATPDLIGALARETHAVTDAQVLPDLEPDTLHLVGFTLNYSQVWLSALIARRIAARAKGRVVFLFGGGTASHPLVPGMLAEKAGLEGLVVLGEGELKLERLVRRCLDAPQGLSDDALLAELENVDQGVFRLSRGVDLTDEHPEWYRHQLGDLGRLPLPDYREYFTALRGLCADESTYRGLLDRIDLTVEGSRGCFAKCDFCSLNRSWSGFRKHAPRSVAETVRQLRQEHRTGFVYFADNVCDTWAEGWAREVVERGERVPAHMQVRAHHGEAFWTSLSLAGVQVVQLGVEAISGPLLRHMNKGTTVIQNLRSQKHLAELGVRCTGVSNLITHHPRSTVADVVETRRIIDQILHLGCYALARFQLQAGCPLYAELSAEQKRQLEPNHRARFPADLTPWVFEKEVAWPPEWRQPEVEAAWDALGVWLDAARARVGVERLDVLESTSERVWVRGHRKGEHVELLVEGEAAHLVELCHQGPTVAMLARTLDTDVHRLMPVLERLLQQGLLLQVGPHYLSLPLRHRDTLLARHLRGIAEARS